MRDTANAIINSCVANNLSLAFPKLLCYVINIANNDELYRNEKWYDNSYEKRRIEVSWIQILTTFEGERNMYCTQCGKYLAEGTRFCSNCGAPVGNVQQNDPYQQPQQVQPQQVQPQQVQPQQPQSQQVQPQPQQFQQAVTDKPQSKEKKKTPVWVSIIVIIAAFVIGKYVVAPILVGGGSSSKDKSRNDMSNDSSYSSDYSDYTDDSSSNEHNPDFDAVFNDNGIIHMHAGDAAFVKESYTNGVHMVECIEISYFRDEIWTVIDTSYVDLRGMSDEERDQMDRTIRSTFDVFENGITRVVGLYEGSDWYSARLSMISLNESNVLKEAIECGALTTTDGSTPDSLSFLQTRSGLTSNGYIER